MFLSLTLQLCYEIQGGASYVRGGKGEKIERLYREVCAWNILLVSAFIAIVSLLMLHPSVADP